MMMLSYGMLLLDRQALSEHTATSSFTESLGQALRVSLVKPGAYLSESYLGLTPSEYSSGERRRQGGITKTGNSHARRALIEGAWAYRDPAKVSRHLQLRLAKLPKPIQDISWQAQVRLCKRYRRLSARGKNANQVVVAIARALVAFMWAIAQQVSMAL